MRRSSVILLFACLLGPHLTFSSSGTEVERASLEEVVDWMRTPLEEKALYQYIMTGKIRLLFFWVGRDDVGGGHIRFSRGNPVAKSRSETEVLETIEVLFGSDPDKAPRKINRWGAAREVALYPAETPTEISSSAFWGFMKDSKGSSVSEMKTELSQEETERRHRFKASVARVDERGMVSYVVPFYSGTDYDLHEFGDASDMVLKQLRTEDGKLNLLDEKLRQRCGRRQGFLFTMRQLIDAALENRRAPLSRCYLYNAKPYNATLLRLSEIEETRIKLKLQGDRVFERTYHDLLKGRFRVVDQKSGKTTGFEVLFGTEGALRGVPVQITYQPNFWFKAVLNLKEIPGQTALAVP